jgi:hypothetical protein
MRLSWRTRSIIYFNEKRRTLFVDFGSIEFAREAAREKQWMKWARKRFARTARESTIKNPRNE